MSSVSSRRSRDRDYHEPLEDDRTQWTSRHKRSPDSRHYDDDEDYDRTKRRRHRRSRSRSKDRSHCSPASRRVDEEFEEGEYVDDDDDHNDQRHRKEDVPNATIMVRGLHPDITENDVSLPSARKILVVLAQHQLDPKDIRLLRHLDTGVPRGFAFVEFSSLKDSMRWMHETQGSVDIQGYRVSLCYSQPKDARNVRMDWTCFRCGVCNFKRRDECFKCGTEREESEESSLDDDDVSPNPTNCLLLRNLAPQVTSDQVLALVGSLSNVPIKSIRLPEDPVTKTFRGVCFLELHSTQEAIQLLSLLGSSNTVSLAASCPLIFSFARKPSSGVPGPRTGVASAALAAAQWTNSLTSPAAIASLGTVTVDGVTYQKFPKPDPTKFQLEKSSGFFYDQTTRLYYDPKSKYYYNGDTQTYLYWSDEHYTYIPVSTQSKTLNCQNSAKTQESKDSDTKEPEPKEKLKSPEDDKVKAAKKIVKDMERWAKTLNQKSATNEASQPSEETVNETPNQESFNQKNLSDEEEKLLDWEKLICVLCKRQFSSKEQLSKHKTASGLHKSNLESLAATMSVVERPDNGQYVDRAKERRKKWGNEHQPIETPKIRESSPPTATQSSASSSKPIDSSNVGAKMLKAMGWKEGQGLGKNNTGRTDIIEVEPRNETAGLGNRSATRMESGETYKDAAKRAFTKKFMELNRQ